MNQFTPSQIELIKDNMESGLNVDNISLYGMRPPELYFVDNPTDYLRWFVKKGTTKKEVIESSLNDIFSECLWIDGFNNNIKIRPPAIKHVLQLSDDVLDNEKRYFFTFLYNFI